MKYFVLAFSIFLCACTATNPKPPIGSAIEAAEQVRKETQAGVFSPYSVLDPSGTNPGVKFIDGLYSIKKWWCATDKEIVQTLTEKIEEYCRASGGELLLDQMTGFKSGWCHGKSEGTPLFYTKIGKARMNTNSGNHCTSGTDVGIFLIQQKGSEGDAWENYTTKYNYQTIAQLREHDKRVYAARKAKAQKDLAEAEFDREWNRSEIMKSGVGSQVCKKSGSYIHIGYIDRVENNRVRIEVVAANYVNSNRSVQGFKSTVRWDDPGNWYLCH